MSPKGFWSYARGDDDHLDGVLSKIRSRIAGEVSMLLGHDVGIFQDIHDLRTGDDWAACLRAGVANASFLIPVLTPQFFNRPWCREEVLTFLQAAKDKGQNPLVFPILFGEVDEDKTCEVRAALAPFQYKDLSHWRFESDPTRQSKLLYEFAKDVKARLNVAPAPRPAAKAAATVMAVQHEVPRFPVEKPADGPKYKTYVVDPMHRGDFTTIAAAIAAAEPGSKIVVREGTYREALRLSKPLEIVGEGDRERILVVTDTGNALHCDAPMARISGLRFRREAGGKGVGIWISDGAAEIDDCVVESLSRTCVVINGPGSSPSLRRCVLRQGAQGGLFVFGGAQPVVEDCEMLGNALSGVTVMDVATRPTLRRCIARDGKQVGYTFADGAGGVMERCEAVGNGLYGVAIGTGADPSLRDCILRDNAQSGVLINESGRGRLQDCKIEANGGAGVAVRMAGAPDVTGCTISRNAHQAVWIQDSGSGGVFRGNDLRGNTHGAWDIAKGATVTRSDNTE
jgi:hypothetical protein